MTSLVPFSFEQHAVRTVERDGQVWFIAADVCAVLSIKNPRDSVRHLDDDEKGVVSTDTLGGQQQMTIVNESGLYALVLRSRKPEARRFAKWVTAEVLPAIRKTGSYTAPAKRQPKALPYGLTHDQQTSIKALVKARVEALPQDKQAKAAITCWSALKSKFGCTYKEIESAQFAEALSLVARLPLEGELLEAEQPKPLELHYPVSWLPEHNPHLRGYSYERSADPSLHLNTSSLCGMDARSPSLALIGELTRAGYDVEACRVELLAMRHQLERYSDLCRNLATLADRHQHGGIIFKLTGQAQAFR